MKGLVVSKWGNGQGIRIPQAILKLLSISVGDQLNLEVDGDRIILTPIKQKKVETLSDLFANYSGPSYQELFGDEMKAWENMKPVGNELAE